MGTFDLVRSLRGPFGALWLDCCAVSFACVWWARLTSVLRPFRSSPAAQQGAMWFPKGVQRCQSEGRFRDSVLCPKPSPWAWPLGWWRIPRLGGSCCALVLVPGCSQWCRGAGPTGGFLLGVSWGFPVTVVALCSDSHPFFPHPDSCFSLWVRGSHWALRTHHRRVTRAPSTTLDLAVFVADVRGRWIL